MKLSSNALVHPEQFASRHIVHSRFLLKHCTQNAVEAEVKLGSLIKKTADERTVNLAPVACETSLHAGWDKKMAFVSDFGSARFIHLNAALNARVLASERDGAEEKVTYTRTQELEV